MTRPTSCSEVFGSGLAKQLTRAVLMVAMATVGQGLTTTSALAASCQKAPAHCRGVVSKENRRSCTRMLNAYHKCLDRKAFEASKRKARKPSGKSIRK